MKNDAYEKFERIYAESRERRIITHRERLHAQGIAADDWTEEEVERDWWRRVRSGLEETGGEIDPRLEALIAGTLAQNP
jgi:hypothetical protein